MKKNAKIINGDTLLLINATKNEAGNYSCVATNHITDQRRTSPNVVQLLVHEPSRNAKSRLIHRPKDNYEVKLGIYYVNCIVLTTNKDSEVKIFH